MSLFFLSAASANWTDKVSRLFTDISAYVGDRISPGGSVGFAPNRAEYTRGQIETELASARCFIAIMSSKYAQGPTTLAEMKMFNSRMVAYRGDHDSVPPAMVKLHWGKPDRPKLSNSADWADFEPDWENYQNNGLQAILGDPTSIDYNRLRLTLGGHIIRVVRDSARLPRPTINLSGDRVLVDAFPVSAIEPAGFVPGFDGDSPGGPDRLGMDTDATALALLLASTRLQPPLALGLYGRWGTGKTFMMRRIESRIADLAGSGDPQFCRNVTSVWFNAWHYAGADLWSSLVHQIFASLRGDRPDRQHRVDQALARIRGLEEVQSDAQARIDAAQEQIGELEREVAAKQAEYQQAIADATRVRAGDLLDVLKTDDNLDSLRESLNGAAAELGMPAVGTDVAALEQGAKDVIAAARDVRQLSVAGPWWCSPLVVGLAVAVVLAVVGVLAESTFTMLGRGPIIQIVAIGSGVIAWAARQAKLLPKLLKPANDLQRAIRRRVDEQQKKLDEHIAQIAPRLEKATAEFTAAQRRLDDARQGVSAAKVELAQLNGPRRLERYLAERAGSADYKPYLGVVALAHRDLRDLDGYLQKSATGDDTDIDRIVLYIDDLDRCDPATVVRVLEAVHLLLALPTFVVVVGVDPGWLATSLARHALRRTIPAADYLDKIFQLSYQVPAMTQQGRMALLRGLAGGPQIPAAEPAAQDPVLAGGGPTAVEMVGREVTEETPEAYVVPTLAVSDEEIESLGEAVPLAGRSPRMLKRFFNTYRVVKASALMDAELAELLRGADGPAQLERLQILTALAVGAPRLLPALAEEIDKGSGLTVSALIAEHLGECDPADEIRLSEFRLNSVPAGTMTVAELAPWLRVVNRFTAHADMGR